MQPDIKKKLSQALACELSAECQVMYILVPIRKLIDMNVIPGSDFSALKMYSNWVVHDKLSKKSPEAEGILKAFDDEKERRSEGFGSTTLTPYLSLGTFRSELRKFLVAVVLPTNVVDDDDKWRSFVSLFTAIVADCPIEYTAATTALRHVRIATLNASRVDD